MDVNSSTSSSKETLSFPMVVGQNPNASYFSAEQMQNKRRTSSLMDGSNSGPSMVVSKIRNRQETPSIINP